MPPVAELGFFPLDLCEPSLGIGGRAVSVVAAPLAAEGDLGVAASTPGGGVLAVLAPFFVPRVEAFQGGGGFDQGAVHAEVLPGEQLLRLGLATDLLEEDPGHLRGKEPVPVLGEARGVPSPLGEGEAHEPAEEQVV